MLLIVILIQLVAIVGITAGLGQTQICRFVCPDSVGGSPLQEEILNPNGAVNVCDWFGNGLALRFASFDSAGNVIPGSASSNNQFTTRAGEHCTQVTEGWTWANNQVCINDTVSSRILERDTIVQLSNNSPEACTAACDALGFTFAGTEFGSECHCGVGLTTGTANIPHTQCNMACTGNSSETCGAGDHMEAFQGPNPPRAAQLPAGWSAFADAPCARDSAARMFVDTFIAGPLLAATNTPAACVDLCIQNGFDKAGVEGGDECYCGTEFRSAPELIDQGECNQPCQGAPGIFCGGNFAIQLYLTS
ncbi:hypothetical protein HGRIS_009096 [Hohenbuehelia grisea]|uniref:WSC domain-containing protein n=1 Tax=Hohenbuehelia grisea TaxID=104357 RepID=A0ABR3J045_9AGAR